jgi:hypothetical protein
MKKMIMGMIALMLISGGAFASDNKKSAKKAETKKECKPADCKDKKDCKPAPNCAKVCKPASCGK